MITADRAPGQQEQQCVRPAAFRGTHGSAVGATLDPVLPSGGCMIAADRT
ncbi:hypothetical protein [Pseudonocardia oceani]|uniref:Uncharacterized protein n=1 Tax=Pseudonocardia oceani TaxID=2792013 RepID=A0ABS6U543_9PSEU|nr:hypothetical protein [Pseudonocardia oceani]MBW0127344.1 hypothetical protein [Pseudonocardia oceani]